MPRENSADEWIMRLLVALEIDYHRVSHVIIDWEVDRDITFYITYHGAKGLARVQPPSASAGKIVITGEGSDA